METKNGRDTKELTTSEGSVIVYKAWISGGEFNRLQEVWLSGAIIGLDDEKKGEDAKKTVTGYDATLKYKVERKMLELMVVSVNGVSEGDLAALVEELPKDEYAEVVAAIELASGRGDKKKSP